MLLTSLLIRTRTTTESSGQHPETPNRDSRGLGHLPGLHKVSECDITLGCDRIDR